MTVDEQSAELEVDAARLVEQALLHRAVARMSLGDGLNLFAYPGDALMLFGVGLQRDAVRPSTVEHVLTRRAQSPQQYAPWLPAEFADGSFFVLLRLSLGIDGNVRPPVRAELKNALALLAS